MLPQFHCNAFDFLYALSRGDYCTPAGRSERIRERLEYISNNPDLLYTMLPSSSIPAFREAFRQSRNIIAVAGAGLSAASGKGLRPIIQK